MLVRFTMAYHLTILNQWNSNKLLRTWSKTQLAMSLPKAGCLSPSFAAPCIFQSSFSSFTFCMFAQGMISRRLSSEPLNFSGDVLWARPSDWREIALDYPSDENPEVWNLNDTPSCPSAPDPLVATSLPNFSGTYLSHPVAADHNPSSSQ